MWLELFHGFCHGPVFCIFILHKHLVAGRLAAQFHPLCPPPGPWSPGVGPLQSQSQKEKSGHTRPSVRAWCQVLTRLAHRGTLSTLINMWGRGLNFPLSGTTHRRQSSALPPSALTAALCLWGTPVRIRCAWPTRPQIVKGWGERGRVPFNTLLI